MTNNKYTAITIGPIYDTFTQAKRTRSIWAASYFFSLFMREVLDRVIKNQWKILLPYDRLLENEKTRGVNKGKHGAGLYADRLYFIDKSKKDVEDLLYKEEGILDFFAKDINEHTSFKDYDTVKTFLKAYLNLHVVEVSFPIEELKKIETSKDEKGNSDNSVLKILNDLLDNKELNKQYVFNYNSNYLIEYFTAKWNENTVLKTDAFGEGKGRHFKSIAEISTIDLLKGIDEEKYNQFLKGDFRNEDVEIIDLLKKDEAFKHKIQDYHKYYGVLYADGDNIGDLLKSVANDDTKLQTFSKKLLEFGLLAEETIHRYGGSAIYLGGEDILAFLPIAYKDGETLKSLAVLIKELDKDFSDTLGTYAAEQKVTIPTLSYGLMLTYYKFPMREVMAQAHEMLEICKHNKAMFPHKNGVSVRFQKHSGQYMQCFIDKSRTDSTKLIYNLLTLQLQGKDRKNSLSGLIQRLKDDVFFATYIHAVRNDRTEAFLKNFFNEDIHIEHKSDFIDFFAALSIKLKKEYLTQSDEGKMSAENKRFKDILFTVLRYYQFIQPKTQPTENE